MYIKHHLRGKASNTNDVSHLLNQSDASQYWLGFIYANCNYLVLQGQEKGIRVNALEEDSQHLSQLSTYLGFKAHPVRTKLGCVLNIYSVELVTLMQELGCLRSMKERTFTERSIELVANPLFWRGYIDGNGYFVPGVMRDDMQLRVQTYPKLYKFWEHYLQQFVSTGEYTIQKMKDVWETILVGEGTASVLQALYSRWLTDGTQTLFAPHMKDAVLAVVGEKQESQDGMEEDAIDGHYKDYIP